MKLRLTLGLIGCTLMTILASITQPAQASLDFGTSLQLRTCPSRSGRLTVDRESLGGQDIVVIDEGVLLTATGSPLI